MTSTAMDTALAGPSFGYFAALRMTVGEDVIRLIDGPASLVIGGETYTGRDGTYGVIASMEDMTEGAGEQMPTLRFGLKPPTTDAAAVLNDPARQGESVEVFVGCFVKSTGLVVADPELLAIMEVDVPGIQSGPNDREAQFDCVSELERLTDTDTGARLNHAWLTSIFPEDNGLDKVVRILNHAPAGAVYGGGGPGGYGVGFGGGIA